MIQPPAQPLPCLEALEPRLAPAGIVAVNVKGGVLTLTGDRADNNVEIYDAGDGQWGIRDGALEPGSTTFRLNGGAEVSEVFVTVTGGVKSNLKGGDDSLRFYQLEIDGPVTLTDSGGDDYFDFQQNEIRGVVKLNLGTGYDNVYAHGNSFDSTLSLRGSGFNGVRLESGNYSSINASFGTGSNEFLLTDSAEGSAINVFGDVTVTSRDNRDAAALASFGADQFKLTGDVKVRTGGGMGALVFNDVTHDGNVTIIGDVSFQSRAQVSNRMVLADEVTIGGELELKMKTSQGINRLLTQDLTQATFGSFSYTGGGEANVLAFQGGLSMQGDVSLNMAGDGGSNVSFSPTAEVFIGGDLILKGGRAEDLLQAQGPEFKVLGELAFSGGQGFGKLAIESVTGILGQVTYKGGKDADLVQLGSLHGLTSNLEILGQVNLNLGKGSNEALVYDANIQGDVSIRSATQTSVRDGSSESLTVADSLLLGSLDIRMTGSQGGLVVLNNSSFLGSVKVNSGRGDDRVHLDSGEIQTGDRASTNLFDAPVSILLGAGDDRLRMGSQDSSNDLGNVFKSRVSLDGGKGTDPAMYWPGSSNVFDGALVERNFEEMP